MSDAVVNALQILCQALLYMLQPLFCIEYTAQMLVVLERSAVVSLFLLQQCSQKLPLQCWPETFCVTHAQCTCALGTHENKTTHETEHKTEAKAENTADHIRYRVAHTHVWSSSLCFGVVDMLYVLSCTSGVDMSTHI